MTSRSPGHLFLSTMSAWLAMLATIAIIVGLGLAPREVRDPDIHSHAELAFTIMVVGAIPLFLVSVGVFLPVMLVLRRLTVWQPSRFWSGVVGTTLVVPAMLSMAVVGKVLGWQARGPVPRGLVLLIAFGGFVCGLTMPRTK